LCAFNHRQLKRRMTEENKNIPDYAGASPDKEPEQPAENIPGETIPSEETTMPESAEQPLNELNDNMEVHHHSHASHGKKTWKAYFWEFLMLFLAVFCGFLAEYALEHKIEADREEQYMYSLSEDLRRDTANLNQAYEFGQNQKAIIDTLIDLVYNQPITGTNISRLYMLYYSSARAVGLTFEDRTTVQLRNAGGMRLLRNTNAVDSILTYWDRLETMDFIKERLLESGDDIGELGVRIFHSKFIIPGTLPLAPPKAIKEDAVLIDNDPKLMAQFVNLQYTKRARLVNYLYNLKRVKETAKRLLETIQKAYHLK